MFDEIKERLNPNPKGLSAEGQLINYYRNVFNTDEGRVVLAHLLTDLGLFNELEATEEEVARHNAAIRILRNLGIIRPSNIAPMVNSLMDLPVKLI